MDEKKLAIILGATGLLLIFVILFFVPSKGKKSRVVERKDKYVSNSSNKTDEKPGITAESPHFSGGDTVENADSVKIGADSALVSSHKVATSTSAATASHHKESGVAAATPAKVAAVDGASGFSVSPESSAAFSTRHSSVSNSAKTTQITTTTSGNSSDGAVGASARSSGSSSQAGETDTLAMAQRSNELRSSTRAESPRLAFTEEEAKALRATRQAVLSKVFEQKKNWIASKVGSGSNLSPKIQARYRLKLIEGYVDGNEAMKKGNWAEAIRAFMAGIKDPDADAVTRYTCFDQMRMSAKMLKDYDLYLEILKEQGLLAENEDLTVLGIEKTNAGNLFYESRRRFIQAIKDPVYGFKKSVDELMEKGFDGKPLEESDRKSVEDKFRKDLADWQADFERTS